MRYLLLILCFVILKFGFTQTVLLEEKVDSVYPTSKFGINSKHFFHSYVGYAFVFDKNSSSIEKTKFWGTQNFSLGLRYKRRLLNHLATGLEAEIRYSSFNVPIEKPILKKQYQTWDLKLAWYYRVNFGMRGAIMGKFLDIGLYGSRFLNARRYTKYDVNQQGYKYTRRYDEGLNMFNSYNYGILVRLGINQWVIFSEYRLSELLNGGLNNLKDFPRWSIGLQISFHQ